MTTRLQTLKKGPYAVKTVKTMKFAKPAVLSKNVNTRKN